MESKLGGIESNATADQSDAEIETAYNNQVALVSQAEAEAGVATTVRRWTAARIKQAIDALSGNNAISDSDISSSGYIEFNNDLMLQWGSITNDDDSNQSFSFPTTFNTACFGVVLGGGNVGSDGDAINTVTTSGFSFDRGNTASGSQTIYYIAVGN